MDPVIKFQPISDKTKDVLKGDYFLGYSYESINMFGSDNVFGMSGPQTASHYRTMELETDDRKKVLLINPNGATGTLNMRVSAAFSHGPEVRVPTKADTWYLTDVTPDEFEKALALAQKTGLINITPDGLTKAGIRQENSPAPATAPSP